jgi:hypothetical protein
MAPSLLNLPGPTSSAMGGSRSSPELCRPHAPLGSGAPPLLRPEEAVGMANRGLLRASAAATEIEASLERTAGSSHESQEEGEGVGELGRKGSTRGSSGIAAGRCRGIGGPICDSYMIRGVFHKIATRAPGHRALPPRAREASWGDTYPRERGENSKGLRF